MSRRLKFRPRIRRIILDPEQAVLHCDCYNVGYKFISHPTNMYNDGYTYMANCRADPPKVHHDHWYCHRTDFGASRSIPNPGATSS